MLESQIQDQIKRHLEARGWVVLNMHGNRYQRGVPDLYAINPRYGPRWVEVKRPDKPIRFTQAQKDVFPKMIRAGDKIWLMQGVHDYDKLFGPPNLPALKLLSKSRLEAAREFLG